jgi:hypothetical protein
LLSLIAAHAALTNGAPVSGSVRAFFVMAGLSIGLAVLTSQKLLMAGPSLAVLALWYLASGRFAGARRDRVLNVACQALAALAVWSMPLIYFAWHGAADDFLRLTLLQSVRWKPETTPGDILSFLARYEPWLFALTAGGVSVLLSELGQSGNTSRSNVFLLLTALGVFLGLFLVPVPYAQYCLTFIPLFAIISATFLVELTRTLSATGRWREALRLSGKTLIAVLVVLGLSCAGLNIARPIIVTWVFYPLLVVVATLTVLTLPFYRRSDIALSVLVLALSVYPAQWTRWMWGAGDRGQFAELRYVLENTRPTGVVLEGWTGYGVFRRHAGYYWVFHPGVRAMITPAAVDELVRNLRTKRIKPDMIVLDAHLRRLSPDLVDFVENQYAPVGLGDIRVPKR